VPPPTLFGFFRELRQNCLICGRIVGRSTTFLEDGAKFTATPFAASMQKIQS